MSADMRGFRKHAYLTGGIYPSEVESSKGRLLLFRKMANDGVASTNKRGVKVGAGHKRGAKERTIVQPVLSPVRPSNPSLSDLCK